MFTTNFQNFRLLATEERIVFLPIFFRFWRNSPIPPHFYAFFYSLKPLPFIEHWTLLLLYFSMMIHKNLLLCTRMHITVFIECIGSIKHITVFDMGSLCYGLLFFNFFWGKYFFFPAKLGISQPTSRINAKISLVAVSFFFFSWFAWWFSLPCFRGKISLSWFYRLGASLDKDMHSNNPYPP